MTAGSPLGLASDGTEALSVLRIEKGHAAGNELNGQTTARDLGLGSMMSKKKDFIGRIMAERPALVDPKRPSLIGFKPVDRSQRLGAGAHVFKPGSPPTPETDLGYLTSTCFSPALGHWIGLGMLAVGQTELVNVFVSTTEFGILTLREKCVRKFSSIRKVRTCMADLEPSRAFNDLHPGERAVVCTYA